MFLYQSVNLQIPVSYFGGVSGIEGGVKMRSKVVILCMTGVLLLLGLNGSANSQTPDLPAMFEVDTMEIAIVYTTAYPGTEGMWLTVWMKNSVPVLGYDFYLGISNRDLARFCQDDTGGCVVSNGEIAGGCECLDEDCLNVHTWNDQIEIPPNPNYVTLFKICATTCCIPDSTTDRCARIYLDGQLFGAGGSQLPFRYHQGELCVWWSVPGDANADSLVTMADVVFLTNYLFRGGTKPCVCEAADCNGDCVIDVGDLVYLIEYLFRNGPLSVPGCVHCPHENCWPE